MRSATEGSGDNKGLSEKMDSEEKEQILDVAGHRYSFFFQPSVSFWDGVKAKRFCWYLLDTLWEAGWAGTHGDSTIPRLWRMASHGWTPTRKQMLKRLRRSTRRSKEFVFLGMRKELQGTARFHRTRSRNIRVRDSMISDQMYPILSIWHPFAEGKVQWTSWQLAQWIFIDSPTEQVS